MPRQGLNWRRWLASGVMLGLLVSVYPAEAQAVPAISRLTPNPAVAGEQVTVVGADFGSFNTVRLVGSQADVSFGVAALSGTQLFFRLPATLPADSYQLTVTTFAGTSNPLGLTVHSVRPPPAPGQPPAGGVTITEVAPGTAPVGTRIMIRGTGFGSYNVVSFTGPAERVEVAATSADGRQLFVTVPTGLPSGPYQVVISNWQGTSNSRPLAVEGSPAPVPSPTPTASPIPGQTLRYVALGDSVARGFFGLFTYVGFYRDGLQAERGVAVAVDNLAVGGWTSAQLREGLQHDERLRAAVRGADIITWNIGGNDLRRAREQYRRGTCGGPSNQDCLRAAVDDFKVNWQTIVREITQLRQPGALAQTMDIYYPFVDEDGPHFAVLNPYFTEVNRTIATVSVAAGIAVAPVHAAFNSPAGNQDPDRKGYLTFDGYHPSRLGHQVIADLLRR